MSVCISLAATIYATGSANPFTLESGTTNMLAEAGEYRHLIGGDLRHTVTVDNRCPGDTDTHEAVDDLVDLRSAADDADQQMSRAVALAAGCFVLAFLWVHWVDGWPKEVCRYAVALQLVTENSAGIRRDQAWDCL